MEKNKLRTAELIPYTYFLGGLAIGLIAHHSVTQNIEQQPNLQLIFQTAEQTGIAIALIFSRVRNVRTATIAAEPNLPQLPNPNKNYDWKMIGRDFLTFLVGLSYPPLGFALFVANHGSSLVNNYSHNWTKK
jgi:hypothetical protein